MYFGKSSPRTTCLSSAASICPRRASADFQRISARARSVLLVSLVAIRAPSRFHCIRGAASGRVFLGAGRKALQCSGRSFQHPKYSLECLLRYPIIRGGNQPISLYGSGLRPTSVIIEASYADRHKTLLRKQVNRTADPGQSAVQNMVVFTS